MKMTYKRVILATAEGAYLSNYGNRGNFERHELLECGHTWSKFSGFGHVKAAMKRHCVACHNEAITLQGLMSKRFSQIQLGKMSAEILLLHWNKMKVALIGTTYENMVMNEVMKRGGFGEVVRKIGEERKSKSNALAMTKLESEKCVRV